MPREFPTCPVSVLKPGRQLSCLQLLRLLQCSAHSRCSIHIYSTKVTTRTFRFLALLSEVLRHTKCPAKRPRKRASKRRQVAAMSQQGSPHTHLSLVQWRIPRVPGRLSCSLIGLRLPELEVGGNMVEMCGPWN